MSLVILCSCGDDKPEPNVIVRPKDPKAVMAANLGEYLSKDYPSNVSYVEVTSDQVIVKGSCSGSGNYVHAEITPWQDVTEMEIFPYTESISGKSFTVTMKRIVPAREGIRYDRVFSK